MMIRSIVGVGLVLGALAAAAGCEGGASSRCDAIYSKVEQMPEFKGAGLARYGNELRAAFGEGCAKLPESELACMEAAKTSDDLEKCPDGRHAFAMALEKMAGGR